MAANIKDKILSLINDDRKQFSVPELELDSVASEIADTHASDMASNSFTSNWSLSGVKPYQRYYNSGSGITSHVTELVFGKDVSGDEKFNYLDESFCLELVNEARAEFATRESPAVNNADHTHVAVGVCATKTSFRYVEVYIDRYVELLDALPDEIVGSEVNVTGKVLSPKYGPFCCIVYQEAHEEDIGADVIGQQYATPCPDYTSNKSLVVWPWQISFNEETLEFTVPISFPTIPQDGRYYIQVFVKNDPSRIPYEDEVEGIEIPPAGSICSTTICLPVNSPVLDSTMKSEELDVGTIEERQAKAMAFSASSKPDPMPITDVEVISGVGLLVPDAAYEQHLFLPVERQENGTISNLSLSFARYGAGDAEEKGGDDGEGTAGSMGITQIEFVNEQVAPDGFSIVGDNLNDFGGEADDGEEKKQSAPPCYLCVKRSSLGGENAPPLVVDLAVVYGTEGFEMGGGFVTRAFPQSVRETYGGEMFICYKVEGKGREAHESHQVAAAMSANEKLQLADDGSAGSVGSEVDEFVTEIDTDLTRDEILSLERQKEAEMSLARDQSFQEEEKRMRLEQLTNLEDGVEDLEQQRTELTKEHAELQKRLAAVLTAMKRRDDTERSSEKEAIPAHEMEKQYNDVLTSIVEGEEKLNSQKSEYDKVAIDLQTRLDEKEYKANEISRSFREFKREIMINSENSRTGKPMSVKVVDQFEISELKKDEEAERVRLKNINLRMSLKKLEAKLRAKEQLAEGLHLIDFEQLKIENQTLNEKIEERNEELHKLRKKNTTTVQVLTHIKEKLQAVTKDNGVVRGKLADLDAQLNIARDKSTKLKAARESVRAENALLKQKQGFANSDLLVVDYETRKEKMEEMMARMTELKERHALLVATTKDFQVE